MTSAGWAGSLRVRRGRAGLIQRVRSAHGAGTSHSRGVQPAGCASLRRPHPSPSMNRTLRIFAVTVGLLAAGAVAGALASVAALAIGMWLSGDSVGATTLDREILAVVAMLGGLFGGVLLPATAWVFLRRVPLGLAVLGTLIGTTVGGIVGWVVRP